LPSLITLCPLLLAAFTATAPGGGDAVAAAPSEHPAAISMLNLEFTGSELRIGLRLQELTLREVPRWLLDTDLSGEISNFEFEAGWARVAEMIEESLWLELDGEVVHPEFYVDGYQGSRRVHPDGSFDFDYVQLDATLPLPDSLVAARVHSDLFLDDGNPKHRLMISVRGLGPDSIETLLDFDHRDYDFGLPSASSVLGRYIQLGWEHVLIGWDHLAFLLALLFGVACLKDLLWAVTAFTLAHSITLALSALDVFSLTPMVVEPGIAFSVLAVLAWHLRRGAARSRAWIPAFGFGLLHGFGFAGVLGEIGLPAGERTMSLLGFNLGVEFGQLTFVLPTVLVVLILRNSTPATAHGRLREAVALPALAFAMYLVGTAVLNYWIDIEAGLVARMLTLACGAAAALVFCLLPCGDTEKLRSLRRLTWQAALLLAFFHLGQQLRT
jgi:hypothetical protein